MQSGSTFSGDRQPLLKRESAELRRVLTLIGARAIVDVRSGERALLAEVVI
jgi:hypothetical protein